MIKNWLEGEPLRVGVIGKLRHEDTPCIVEYVHGPSFGEVATVRVTAGGWKGQKFTVNARSGIVTDSLTEGQQEDFIEVITDLPPLASELRDELTQDDGEELVAMVGYTQTEIANAIGMTASSVSRGLSLLGIKPKQKAGNRKLYTLDQVKRLLIESPQLKCDDKVEEVVERLTFDYGINQPASETSKVPEPRSEVIDESELTWLMELYFSIRNWKHQISSQDVEIVEMAIEDRIRLLRNSPSQGI
jgi:predicted transcriptional regulator